MKTEKEKAREGLLYDANYDAELVGERLSCADRTFELNRLRPSQVKEREEILRGLLFGDNVFIAPGCGFYTAGHPLDVERRNAGLEYALPIRVGNNVWIGAGVCVLPGVTIGDNTVIGAGSVVTKDIPSGVLAAGNPCRVIREISADDVAKYR